jgi:hypothetical protein
VSGRRSQTITPCRALVNRAARRQIRSHAAQQIQTNGLEKYKVVKINSIQTIGFENRIKCVAQQIRKKCFNESACDTKTQAVSCIIERPPGLLPLVLCCRQ